MTYDPFIKGAEVTTAADVARTDIGIWNGKVATLSLDLGEATEILDSINVAKRHGAMVMCHEENEDEIDFLRDYAERDGSTGPHYHAATRPIPVEREAIHRTITLAEITGVQLTIVQASNGDALDEIKRARVNAETCPQCLKLTADDLDRSGFDGGKYVCWPPPRDAANEAACWAGLEQGNF